MGLRQLGSSGGGSVVGTALTSYATQVAALPDYPVVFPSTDEVSVVVYSGSAGTTRPGAEFVVWQGFPTQPTNMADGDLWLSDSGGTVLNGTGAPTSGDGSNGDFWIRTSNWTIYGPKTSGAWGSATSLVGPSGTNGRDITSIARTSGTGAAGTTDTYTITYSDATTSTFNVVNGADGTGSPLTVQDEGSALSTAATTINFVGSGVTATGTGAAKTITIPGGSGTSFTRSDYTKPTGTVRETIDRMSAVMGSGTLTSGSLWLVGVSMKAGDVCTSASIRGVGSGLATITHSWAVICDTSRTVLAVSPDDTTATTATGVNRTFTFSSPYTIPSDGLYYVGVMLAGGTTQVLSVTGNSNQYSIPPIVVGSSSTGQTTPPSVGATMGALTAQSALPYIWIA